jgi:hypothetical protein
MKTEMININGEDYLLMSGGWVYACNKIFWDLLEIKTFKSSKEAIEKINT